MMGKVPYDDKAYLAAVEQVNSAAITIYEMEGSDVSTLEGIFEQTLDNLREDEDEDDD